MASWHEPRPYPKAVQLARGSKRYRRKIAGPKRWQALEDEKGGTCRVCNTRDGDHLHHLVFRSDYGDDVADNLVPLCAVCHGRVHARWGTSGADLIVSLTDAEYAYMIERGGEDYPERAYGIRYSR